MRRDAQRAGLVGRRGKLERSTFYRLIENKVYIGIAETTLGGSRGGWEPLVPDDLFAGRSWR